MYAVFKTGGKQYRATQGDTLKVEKLDAAEGDSVSFDEVLMVGEGANVAVGTPVVAGGKVEARVINQDRARKVEVVKFNRRQNYKRMHGHRQPFTLIEITGISGAPAASASEE